MRRAGLIGAGILLALALAGVLLLQTSTSEGDGMFVTMCGFGSVSDAHFRNGSSAEYERPVRAGESVGVTMPAGRFRIMVEWRGGHLEPLHADGRGQVPSRGGCPAEPYLEMFRAHADLTMRVRYLLYA